MDIKVPTTKRTIKPYDCVKRSLAVHLGKKRYFPFEISTHKFNVEVDTDYIYYPYWIGTVWTNKERALAIYPDKQIIYYVVTDAITGSFIVLRNIPKTNLVDCSDDKVLPAKISEKDLMENILDQAIEERINKQFIFGIPQSKKQQSFIIYLPMKKIKVKGKEQDQYKNYYVNIFTGEVKTFDMIPEMEGYQ